MMNVVSNNQNYPYQYRNLSQETTGHGGNILIGLHDLARNDELLLEEEGSTSPRAYASEIRVITKPRLQYFDQFYHEATSGYGVIVHIIDRITVHKDPVEEAFNFDDVLEPSQKIAAIRSDLSLNISELASVLKVKRPTIYSWIEGVRLNKKNRDRLEDIFEISTLWRSQCNLPLGDYVRHSFKDAKSLVQILAEESVPMQIVKDFFIQVAKKISQEDRKELNDRSISVRELRKRNRISLTNRRGSIEEVEILGGKRALRDEN